MTDVKIAIAEITQKAWQHWQNLQRELLQFGNCLLQARAILPRGDFLKWLADNFKLSQRTAYNYMGIAERFAANLQPVANCPPSTLIELLALPAAETQNFVADLAAKDKRLEDMSKRQVKAAVAEFKSARLPKPLFALESDTTIDVDTTPADATIDIAELQSNSVNVATQGGRITINGVEVLTYKTAANISNKSVNAIKKLVKRGRLKKVKLGSAAFVTAESVQALLKFNDVEQSLF